MLHVYIHSGTQATCKDMHEFISYLAMEFFFWDWILAYDEIVQLIIQPLSNVNN